MQAYILFGATFDSWAVYRKRPAHFGGCGFESHLAHLRAVTKAILRAMVIVRVEVKVTILLGGCCTDPMETVRMRT